MPLCFFLRRSRQGNIMQTGTVYTLPGIRSAISRLSITYLEIVSQSPTNLDFIRLSSPRRVVVALVAVAKIKKGKETWLLKKTHNRVNGN